MHSNITAWGFTMLHLGVKCGSSHNFDTICRGLNIYFKLHENEHLAGGLGVLVLELYWKARHIVGEHLTT